MVMAFLKDNGGNDQEHTASTPANNADHAADEQQQVHGLDNLMQDSGEQQDAQQEYLTPMTQEKNIRQSTILAGVLFAIGAAVLFFMIKQSNPPMAQAEQSAEELQLENAIAQLTGASESMPDQMEKIVEKFYEFSNVPQVKTAQLVKNPFRHIEKPSFASSELEDAGSESENANSGSRVTPKKESESAITLLGIMNEVNGRCCLINDKLLYEGDSFRDGKVKTISDSYVVLTTKGGETVLKMER